MNNIITASLSQLLVQAPVLLVYLAGLVLALVFWRRCPTASVLVLVAIGLLLLLVPQVFLTNYLIQSRAEMDWTHERLGWMLSAIGFTTGCVRAVALGLLLAAVFVRRKVPQPAEG